MKRYGNIFDKICSFENLLLAANKAQKGKRFKASTGRFNLDLENELIKLQQELLGQTYKMGAYRQFYIYDPKKRLISAAPYRDRVVQHALCNIIEPIFDDILIHDSYACRKDKGSHKAVDRYTQFSRLNKYVLKCDVKSYFASIDHDILYGLISRKIKDPKVLRLIRLIVDSAPSPGIPIGNLTSQTFANLYLNELDHYLKEVLKCRHYIRYMDDMVIFGNDKNELAKLKESIRSYLKKLELNLHENKSQSYLARKGVGFLGYKVYPTHRLVKKQNIKRFKIRMKKYLSSLRTGLIDKVKIIQSVQSWLGYAVHADTYNLRNRIELELTGEGISL
ncbi:MAG: reverse transcriptase domain-containing protein [Candidatus Margulisiibacteriota bacterium]